MCETIKNNNIIQSDSEKELSKIIEEKGVLSRKLIKTVIMDELANMTLLLEGKGNDVNQKDLHDAFIKVSGTLDERIDFVDSINSSF